jgi:hypothetical protein
MATNDTNILFVKFALIRVIGEDERRIGQWNPWVKFFKSTLKNAPVAGFVRWFARFSMMGYPILREAGLKWSNGSQKGFISRCPVSSARMLPV